MFFHCCAQVVRNESVPIQLAHCWFPGLAISNVKIYFFSNKIYGINLINKHSETDMVRNYENADCSLKNKSITQLYLITNM